jgi:hypothetical protein
VIAGVHLEVWLICGYAVFLVFTASVLEHLAWHCHRRSHLIRTAGFNYRREFDGWEWRRTVSSTRRNRPSAANSGVPRAGACLQCLHSQGHVHGFG